jgi:hypothetical protein
MTSETRTRKEEAKAEAIAYLRELLPPGSTASTILRHVAPSGMTRWISVVVNMHDVTWAVARALGENYGGDQRHEGIKVGGCGMDMGFSLIYNLSATLYPDGFDCIGEGNGEHGTGCPSNDHSNDHYDGPPASERYAPTRRHRSGGYAVSQRWL